MYTLFKLYTEDIVDSVMVCCSKCSLSYVKMLCCSLVLHLGIVILHSFSLLHF